MSSGEMRVTTSNYCPRWHQRSPTGKRGALRRVSMRPYVLVAIMRTSLIDSGLGTTLFILYFEGK